MCIVTALVKPKTIALQIASKGLATFQRLLTRMSDSAGDMSRVSFTLFLFLGDDSHQYPAVFTFKSTGVVFGTIANT